MFFLIVPREKTFGIIGFRSLPLSKLKEKKGYSLLNIDRADRGTF